MKNSLSSFSFPVALILKKRPLVDFWCSIQEHPRLSEKTIKIVLSWGAWVAHSVVSDFWFRLRS